VQVLDAIDRDRIAQLRAAGEFFWLDLLAPSDQQLDQLAELFGLHPIAVEDTREFNQRPKLDDYDGFLLLVFYGMHQEPPGDARPVEVHFYITGDAVISVRRSPCSPLEQARRRAPGRNHMSEEESVYRVLDALADSYFPVLERIDDEIDDLEDQILDGPHDGERHRLFALKRELVGLRRIIGPQRDAMASASDVFDSLPGFQGDVVHDYFRDVYDHLIRISDLIDSYRDLLSGALDIYLTTQSNRLNEVMKRLTIVATIFLPLSFLVGFFGQNFAWLVKHITTFADFLIWGVGSLVVAVALLLWLFNRAHYLGSSEEPPRRQ
jgi:magnesium transporter